MTIYKFLKRLRLLIDLDHEHLKLWKTAMIQPGPYTSFIVYLDDEKQTTFRITIEAL